MTKVICLSIIVSFMWLGSCKKKENDTDRCGTSWYTQVQSQLTAVLNAATIYASSPTAANCTTYKNATQAYINALEPFVSCTTWSAADRADWQESLNDAKADVLTMCN